MPNDERKAERQANGRRGYKNPPEEHRFKPGQSGNPKGRPRKNPAAKRPISKKKLLEIFHEEAKRLVWVNEGGEQQQMEFARAFVRQLGTTALKNPRMANLFLQMVLDAEASIKDEPEWDLENLTIQELTELQRLQKKLLKAE